MISLPIGDARFNHRVAAVVIHDGWVLLHRAVYENFWALPGGRIEILEQSDAALARELGEELGPALDAQVDRLLWVVENFFAYEGVPCHELGMYYLVTLGERSAYLDKDKDYSRVENGFGFHAAPVELIFRWFPLSAIGQVRLYPSFLRSRLTELPVHTEHLVHHDSDE